jgi:hypothetical protein
LAILYGIIKAGVRNGIREAFSDGLIEQMKREAGVTTGKGKKNDNDDSYDSVIRENSFGPAFAFDSANRMRISL